MAEFKGAATSLSAAGLRHFLVATGADEAALWAVLAVETSGCGFLPDGRPKILFERHRFHALTGGVHDRLHPGISAPGAGGYGPGGAHQYGRLEEALVLDRAAALKSASWGIGQIMGEYHALAGFADVEAMVSAMMDGEDSQVAAMAAYLRATRLASCLARRDWIGFALGYNGADYARHNYDGLLRQFHGRYVAGPLPDLGVRAVQVALMRQGYDPRGVDGLLGAGTQAAIRLYQGDHGLAQTGCVDAGLRAGLGC